MHSLPPISWAHNGRITVRASGCVAVRVLDGFDILDTEVDVAGEVLQLLERLSELFADLINLGGVGLTTHPARCVFGHDHLVSLYGPVFTALYDPLLAWGERAGMRELRRSVLTAAEGDVLELGAGTGLNINAYPPSIRSTTLTEPEPSMVQRLRQIDGQRNVVTATAESLPFANASFDTVVSTLVLCTVDDVPRTLNEVRRVLRPNGALLLIEHIRSTRPRLASAQDRLHKPWRAVGYGCNCNRDTPAALRRAGFDTTELRSAQWRRMPAIVRPLIAGTARPAASPGG